MYPSTERSYHSAASLPAYLPTLPNRLGTGDMSMKKTPWKSYLFWILFTEGIGFLSGFLTRNSTQLYQNAIVQPPLSPPAIVFPIGAARIFPAPNSTARTRSLLVYLIQLAFNFFWSILFFNLQRFGLAFLWLIALWMLILLMIRQFRKVDPLAALLQIPYLLWVTFAAYLNLGVWLLNC